MRRSIIDSSEDDDEGINLTPMLDVVFIMLIFFIVTASFVKEAGIDVLRPSAPTAYPKKSANILVAISAKNEIWIDNQQVKPQAVRAQIERLHAENPEGAVMIQADKGSNAETLLQVMGAAREARVSASIAALKLRRNLCCETVVVNDSYWAGQHLDRPIRCRIHLRHSDDICVALADAVFDYHRQGRVDRFWRISTGGLYSGAPGGNG